MPLRICCVWSLTDGVEGAWRTSGSYGGSLTRPGVPIIGIVVRDSESDTGSNVTKYSEVCVAAELQLQPSVFLMFS